MMLGRARHLVSAGLVMLLSACDLVRCSAPKPLDQATIDALYAKPLPPPAEALSVYHLGHSLVGRDMPAMLAQLAGAEHSHHSQLGWGTPLKGHWTGEINGFDVENDHPRFRAAEDALQSGDYDAFIVTEMIGLPAAIKYHDSWDYLARWTERARAANPNVRVYMYETWHHIDDPDGWLNRLDQDLERYWQGEIIDRAMAAGDTPRPIHVIPAGQVFAAFVRAVEARGGVNGLTGKEDLFALDPEGKQDTIHFNDLGAYLVALTHYAVLYHQSPVGLPHALQRADGSAATAPGAEAARLMQETVWDVVTALPRTGIRAGQD